MNCSRAWANVCIEFTSSRERTDAIPNAMEDYDHVFHLHPQATFVMHRKITAIILNRQIAP